jgi:hypothetical protein
MLLSCDSDTTNPGDGGEPFRLTIEVKDDKGTPMPDVRVGAWNDLSIPVYSAVSVAGDYTEEFRRPATMIPYTVAERSRVNLSVYDLKGDLVNVLVDDVYREGNLSAMWVNRQATPAGIYEIKMVAWEEFGTAVLFADSIYAVLYIPDAEQNILGYTDSNGVFETTNRLLFPSVISGLPELVQTNPLGQPLGTFTYEDSITIALADTAGSGRLAIYRGLLTNGDNTFVFQDPRWLSLRLEPWPGTGTLGSPAVAKEARAPGQQYQWALEQNLPNPFN